ncbi:RNA polymerase sigma-70 factor (ECF subfamily) [Motilibacter peucedani]|uniref:RNA polymerase sigma-70 factor (ECF subfamily) n=1 Tax=Motilibacter peucedani TaxID=598650 RepID=A0A420XUP9_9ACTN|nr:sigma-70 family RNA polymerase sigma factor [Motilibacter peucedani]RKS80555.1 RNA polymerase sigma-70 factor (ECF subfamily) [Motilibacter peucedani]
MTAVDRPEVSALLEDASSHRRELTAYCYRLLGSGAEAEDAVQETMLRAWRSADGFEGRSSLRSWLYRIATNVCIDMQRAPQRRALPMDLGGPSHAGDDLGAPLPESAWVRPVADSAVLPESADPAELVALRDSVRLAFVAALQHLPPRQRAVLVLREVLDWPAAQVAELLDSTVASVNSALARARATLSALDLQPGTAALEPEARPLLERYVAAFEAYDVDALVSLLHDDVTFSMPPLAFWLRGTVDVRGFYDGVGQVCRGSRIVLTRANGSPAVAVYHPAAASGTWEPYALHVIEVRDGRIASICHYLDTSLFPAFELPPALTAA